MAAHKGRKQTPEHIAKRVRARRENGTYTFTDEHRRNLSEAHKGNRWTEETRNKMRIVLTGVKKPPRTPEHCRKISERQSSDKVIKRLLKLSKNHSTYTNGHFLSKKSNRPLFFRSSLELKVYEMLEDSEFIVEIEYEPIILSYNWRGKKRKYVPDILITTTDGLKYLLEVKPERRVEDPKNIAKFSSAVEYCSNNGLTFVLVNDRLKLSVVKTGELLGTPNVESRAISSQAMKGVGFMEGSTTRFLSPNNNRTHERPSLQIGTL